MLQSNLDRVVKINDDPLARGSFCLTCEFRLPYCVRSDREFCGERCRGWWYLHQVKSGWTSHLGMRGQGEGNGGSQKHWPEALVALAGCVRMQNSSSSCAESEYAAAQAAEQLV